MSLQNDTPLTNKNVYKEERKHRTERERESIVKKGSKIFMRSFILGKCKSALTLIV